MIHTDCALVKEEPRSLQEKSEQATFVIIWSSDRVDLVCGSLAKSKPFGFFRFLKPNFVLLCECLLLLQKSIAEGSIAVSSLETSESEVQIYRLESKLWTKTVPFTRWKIKLFNSYYCQIRYTRSNGSYTFE